MMVSSEDGEASGGDCSSEEHGRARPERFFRVMGTGGRAAYASGAGRAFGGGGFCCYNYGNT